MGAGGFCDRYFSHRRWSGAELGPSLNWPQMVGPDVFVNSDVEDILVENVVIYPQVTSPLHSPRLRLQHPNP